MDIINKNVSIWRGDNTPPTQYHLWQKGDVLFHHNGLEWVENKVPMASSDQNGLMSKEDKDKLDNLVCDSLESDRGDLALSAKQGKILLGKITDLNLSVYQPKGSVQTLVDLPVDNLRVGDVYNIINPFYIGDEKYPAGTNVVWTGISWDPLGGTVDFSDYSTTEEVEALIEALRTSKVDKVEGKSLVSDDQITKLTNLDSQENTTANIADAKKAGTDAQSFLDSHTSNVSNPHKVTKDQVGLGNVDNTSDLNKPVSTVQQTALDKKVDKVTGYGLSKNDFTDILKNKLDGIAEGAQVNSITGVKGSSEETYRTGNVSISASNIGLGNVNNTSDADKPISTAQQAALDEKVDKVAGKGLSTNDYTTDEKNKLAGIAVGAQVNVIESVKVNGTAQAISNKEIDIPVPTKLSQLTNDIYEVATSAEITAILN